MDEDNLDNVSKEVEEQSSIRAHINPLFSQKHGHSRVHINPNFGRKEVGNFLSKLTSVGAPPLPQSAPPPAPHVNPNFTHRPLPSLPSLTSRPDKPARSTKPRPISQYSVDHRSEPIYASLCRPKIHLDPVKQAEYEDSIRKRVAASKVVASSASKVKSDDLPISKPARSSLQTTKTNVSPSEKENLPTAKVKHNIFTPLRNSAAFKKFGSRKLVRVKTPTSTPKTSTFQKVGSKKLIRITEKNVASTSKESGSSNYEIKTKTKIVKSVKNTPSNRNKYKFSFITPLTNKKSRYLSTSTGKKSNSGRKSLSSFRSRFKLDRRTKLKQEPQALFKSTSQTRLKRLSGTTYKVSATKLQKVPVAAAKPIRTKYKAKMHSVNPNVTASKVITVQGIKFAIGDNGRKLKRLPSNHEVDATPDLTYSASVSHTTTPPGMCLSSSPQEPRQSPARSRLGSQRFYLGGEEFDQIEPGVFTRSRHSLTRQSITEAKNRSINIILKNQNRSKQYCMFYNKFGKCTKKEKGSCPFLHDQDKVAVCRRFLQGACFKESCLLTHKVAPEKMPTCKFFLEGLCTKDDCPYLHVRVSPEADICESFLKGYCPNGSDCRRRHIMACPEFDRSGICKMVGKCPFPHVDRTVVAPKRTPQSEKRIAPAKPKRKSLGKTPECSKKSRVGAGRYYEDDSAGKLEGSVETIVCVEDDDMEAKKKRLFRKIELAKQGWTGVTVTTLDPSNSQSSETKLDDSGPYERIDSGSESGDDTVASKKVERTPIGKLGDFISLAGYSSEEDENTTKHRLI